MDAYFTMQKANGERIEGVHEDAVEDHKRLGYKLVGPEMAQPATKPADDDPDAFFVPLERFGRVLETARKKPGSAQAKAFAELKIDLSSKILPAQIMSNSIDALVAVTEPAHRDVLKVALFGKEAEYVDELIRQALEIE